MPRSMPLAADLASAKDDRRSPAIAEQAPSRPRTCPSERLRAPRARKLPRALTVEQPGQEQTTMASPALPVLARCAGG
jgi:hypothetical protein